MSYIKVSNVVKEFGHGDAKVTAVRGVDLSIEQGEFLSIMGESGAGKSTLLSMLGGLLSPYLSVTENVQLPLAVTHHSESEKKSLALSALERVGLEDKAHRLPNQLSGGEQERVAIARAVVNEPPILFADEPTGNLDSKNSTEVMNLLKRLNGEGQTIVMVTHSMANAEFADRLIEVTDGRVKEDTIYRIEPAPENLQAAQA
ncbi:MAG: ATP-binding cassette domain-containing protein [Deltaproteobacteria bacterium]